LPKEENFMKAVVVCGSPRRNGNTQMLLEAACQTLNARGVETELILLSGKEVKPCIGCGKCRETKDLTCAIKDDDFHPIFRKILDADAFVIGSPVYFGCATSQTTCLLHRAGYVSRVNGDHLKGKVGGPIVVARRAGQNFTYAQLLMFFMINDMIVPGSTYWNVAFGRNEGEVESDSEGLETIRHFAENVADLLQQLKG
jgi:multimeric flavodoxin WrbA